MHHNTKNGQPAIIHRDIHDENILLECQNQINLKKYSDYKYNVSVIDFGLSIYQPVDGPYKDYFNNNSNLDSDDILQLGDIFIHILGDNCSNNEDKSLFNQTSLFVNKMSTKNLSEDKKITSDDMLNFFVALDNLLTIKKLPIEEQKKYKEEIKDYNKRIKNSKNNSNRMQTAEKSKIKNPKNSIAINQSEETPNTLSLYSFFKSCLNINTFTENKEEQISLIRKKKLKREIYL